MQFASKIQEELSTNNILNFSLCLILVKIQCMGILGLLFWPINQPTHFKKIVHPWYNLFHIFICTDLTMYKKNDKNRMGRGWRKGRFVAVGTVLYVDRSEGLTRTNTHVTSNQSMGLDRIGNRQSNRPSKNNPMELPGCFTRRTWSCEQLIECIAIAMRARAIVGNLWEHTVAVAQRVGYQVGTSCKCRSCIGLQV